MKDSAKDSATASLTPLDKIHGCLLGVMIGDALGAPVEMMTPKEILAQTHGQGILGFDHQIQRKPSKPEVKTPPSLWKKTLVKFGFSKSSAAEFHPGLPHNSITTDDWQLTQAVTTSLIRRRGFDLTDQALSHVSAYESSTAGWGGTTRQGIKELQEYFTSKGHSGRSPSKSPEVVSGRGSGNGVAMKITPLALMHILVHGNSNVDFDLLGHQCAEIGKLTHSDSRAWAAAYALACALVESQIFTSNSYIAEGDRTLLLEEILRHLNSFERRYGSGKLKRFSSYLKVLLDNSLLLGPIENLRKKVGTGCIAIESVVFALAVFLRNPLDFRAGVLEAVNSGGDADTISGMVGALIGFLVGPEGIPEEWKNHSLEFHKAGQTAKELGAAFSTENL